MNEQKQEIKKDVKVAKATDEYMKLNEMLESHIDQVKKFKKFPVKLVRTFAKVTGQEQVYIYLEIHEENFRQFKLKDGKDFISPARFNLLALNMGLEYKNAKGYDVTEWNLDAPVRFIKGKTKFDNEYKAVQVVLSKEDFFTTMFTRNELKLLEKLEKKNLIKIDWVESPEKIDDEVELVDLD
jgi:hypothetical protein